MIETYFHGGEGYNPFLIRDGWQVAQLNWLPGHSFDEMDNFEVHRDTDEVFILVKGCGILLTASLDSPDAATEVVRMTPGVTYNIPAGVWHNIAMDRDAQIVIVEKDNTHLKDVEIRKIDADLQKKLYGEILSLL